MMADFSIQTTGLNAPDLGAAGFTRPGVADRSAEIRQTADLGLVRGVAEQALPIYKATQTAEINAQTQEVIQDYMNRRPETAKGALAGAAAQDVSTSFFRPNAEQLSEVEKAQKNRLAVYKQALDQGVMTPQEFDDRVMANLRELTNKNPGLYDELKAEAARVLELSGITGIVKSDRLMAESRAKREEKILSDMQERAKRQYIYYDSSTPYWELADKVQKAEQDQRLYDLQVRGKERFNMMTTEQARTWVEGTGNDVVRGSLTNANQILLSMVETQGISAATYPKFKAQTEATLDNMHQVFVNSIPVHLRQDPTVKETIDSHAKGIESIKKRLESMASGDDMKKVLVNEVDILKATQQKELRQHYNVEQLDLMSNLLRGVPGVVLEGPVRAKYTSAITAIAGDNFNAPALKEVWPKSNNDNSSETILKSAISLGTNSGDYTGFNRTMGAFNAQVPNIDNSDTRMKFLQNNLSAIAKQEKLSLDSVGVSQVEHTVDLMVNDPKFGIGTLIDTSKGKKVTLDVLPSGKIYFVGQDAQKFNAAYANNINLALDAYAKSRGVTTEQAAKTFIPKYLGPTLTALTAGK